MLGRSARRTGRQTSRSCVSLDAFIYIDAMKPQIFDRRIVCEGYLNVETLRIRLSSGVIISRDIERHGDAAAVLPYNAERRCALLARLFARQYLASPEKRTSGVPEEHEGHYCSRKAARGVGAGCATGQNCRWQTRDAGSGASATPTGAVLGPDLPHTRHLRSGIVAY
jgi:hypothetical protein